MFGRQIALRTAQAMRYPHAEFLDDPTWNFTVVQTLFPAIMPNAFRGTRTEIGLVLYEGVGEVQLSSIVDAYPRSTASDVLTIAPAQVFVRTAHGLDLMPRFTLASAPKLDRILTPGNPDGLLDPRVGLVRDQVDNWAEGNGLLVERIHAVPDYPYDATLQDLARQETRSVAMWASAWLEYPTAEMDLRGPEWQFDLILRAVGLGAAGVAVLLGARKLVRVASRLRLPRRRVARHRPSTSVA
jgi:hypothetical protein